MTQPEYFHETVPGTLWQPTEGMAGTPPGVSLSLPGDAPPMAARVLHTGEIIVRYGVDMLHEYAVLIPGLFESETGYQLTGRAAWDVMWAQFQLYPRAEIIGLRHDGRPGDYLVRELDFADRPRLLAYTDPESKVALGSIQRVYGQLAEPPQLFARYSVLL